MPLSSIIQAIFEHGELAFAAFLITFLVFCLRNFLAPGLRGIPGPFVAKFTNIWRLWDVWNGRADITHNRLHRKYGDYVRLGPNVISISNLATIKEVYGINKGYNKSDFYSVQKQLKDGKAISTLFTSTDEDFHASIKRPISHAYSMTTLTEFEPFVDRTIEVLFKQLTARFASGENANKICDIAQWLQFYAFDVIGELTFSRRLGFIDRGEDIDGVMAELERIFRYSAVVGQMPWLDYLFKKNPLLAQMFKPTGKVAQFSHARLQERLQNPKMQNAPNRDFLDRFLEARDSYPEIATEKQILSWTITNVFAGSDTTAISLRAILYYTLKNPTVLKKLREELTSAVANDRLSFPISFKQSQELPYLDAVIKEALRLHPAVGLPLERVVPTQGLRLSNGIVIPPGTIVGASPWVIHRKEDIFGENVDEFVPERWFQGHKESEAAWKARRLEMTRATFTFGAGPRTCIGKNISLLEIYKLVPSIILKFKIELVEPEKDWTMRNSWFVGQGRIPVRIHLTD